MTVSRQVSGRRGMKCVLAEDNGPVREAMESLFRDEGIEVLGSASRGIEALQLLERLPSTVIVVDLRLPDLDGLEVARRAAEILRKKTSVILYTSEADARVVAQALDAGVRAVVLKDAPPQNLLEALDAVAAGETYIDPRLARGRSNSPR